MQTITTNCGFAVRTVQYAMRAAVSAGELERFHNVGPHGTNEYRVRLENLPPKKHSPEKPSKSGYCDSGKHREPVNGVQGASGAHEDSFFKGRSYCADKAVENFLARDAADLSADKAEDPFERGRKSGYLHCADCGRFGGRCHCDDELHALFDRVCSVPVARRMTGHGEKMSRKQEAAIAALLANRTSHRRRSECASPSAA